MSTTDAPTDTDTHTERRTDARRAGSSLPGGTADRPTEIPKAGWKQVLLRVKDEIKADRVGLMAAGVAFYAMLAIFPAMIAAVTVWGLVADPGQIQQTVGNLASALPEGAATLLTDQMETIAGGDDRTLGWTLVVSLLGALWSASSGTKGLMNAVGAAYDEPETRGFLELRGTALALTVGAVLFALLTLGLIAVVPAVLGVVGLGATAETLITWLRWPLLAVAVVAGLAVVYRVAPDRDDAEWRWTSWGAGVATVVWLAASAGFAWYVRSFGSYGETYGAAAGVIVLMLWFFLTAFSVLLGAELNAELEHQTVRDTTQGEPAPMGQRGAHVADTVADAPSDDR